MANTAAKAMGPVPSYPAWEAETMSWALSAMVVSKPVFAASACVDEFARAGHAFFQADA